MYGSRFVSQFSSFKCLRSAGYVQKFLSVIDAILMHSRNYLMTLGMMICPLHIKNMLEFGAWIPF